MELTLLVKSSTKPEPYAVVVQLLDSQLSLHCDCASGQWGKYCKHKFAILSADKKILHDNDQLDTFHKVIDWISSSDYPALLTELNDYEKNLEIAKKKLKEHKEKIARLMNQGSN